MFIRSRRCDAEYFMTNTDYIAIVVHITIHRKLTTG